jgi:hypothetical protein
MKLLDLLPSLDNFHRIKRASWFGVYLVKPLYPHYPLIHIDMDSIQIEKYCLTYDDLMADDWVVVDN